MKKFFSILFYFSLLNFTLKSSHVILIKNPTFQPYNYTSEGQYDKSAVDHWQTHPPQNFYISSWAQKGFHIHNTTFLLMQMNRILKYRQQISLTQGKYQISALIAINIKGVLKNISLYIIFCGNPFKIHLSAQEIKPEKKIIGHLFIIRQQQQCTFQIQEADISSKQNKIQVYLSNVKVIKMKKLKRN